MFNSKTSLNTTSIYARSKPNSGWTDQLRFCNIPFCTGVGFCSNCIILKHPLYSSWMANSKFALILPGDTASSSRLYDAIRQGTIPIIIGNHQFEVGLPFLWKVRWRDFAFFIPDHFDSSVIKETLLKILDYPDYQLKKRWEVMMKFKDDVSWSSGSSKVIDNILRETKLRCL